MVWQVQLPSLDVRSGTKGFMLVDASQELFGIRFVRDKPSELRPQANVVNIVRKHLPHAVLTDILSDRAHTIYWLLFARNREGQPDWYVRLRKDSPPELACITPEREVLIRMGQRGTFTVKKPFEDPFPIANDGTLHSVLDLLIEPLLQDKDQPAASEKAPKVELGTEISLKQRDARLRLARRLKTLHKSLAKRGAVITKEELAQLKVEATLLKNYSYRIEAGAHEVVLQPEETGLPEPVTIALDAEKSPGENIEDAFIRVKKNSKSLSIGAQKREENLAAIAGMSEDLNRLRDLVLSDHEVTTILRRHRLLRESAMPRMRSSHTRVQAQPYKVYKGPGGVRFLVGKGPKENDALVKSAKANDFWFHVVDGKGSHVIVPRNSLPGRALSETAKQDAAMLAIHHSNLRNEFAGEVYVTERRHIKKSKGMAPGLWNVEKSDTYFYRYKREDLEKLFDQE